MMNKLKKIAFIAISVVLVIALSSGLFYALGSDSDPTVIFDASSTLFTFQNVKYGVEQKDAADDEDPYPDLFAIRGAMPGDSFSWDVNVKVTNATNKKVTMYVRAENDNDDFNALFAADNPYPPTIKVTFPDGSVYTARLNGNEFIEIGVFNGSGTKEINLSLDIDILAGNEIAGLDAEIDWVFYAKVENVTPPPPPPPPPTPTPTPSPEPTDEPDEPLYPPAPELNTEEHFGYIIGTPGGLVRPEDNITRAETATILFRLLTDESRAAYWSTTNSFSDVSSDAWYNNAVSTLENAGIIKGRPDGTFGPTEPITRAEYAVMFARFFDAVPSSRDLFPDIAGHWAREYINTAAQLGFINGRPDGTFGPNDNILRCEAFTLTNRVLGRKPDKDHLHEDMVVWSDNTPDKWYYAQVQEATNSHEYQMYGEDTDSPYEDWTAITPMRDWAALEKQWAQVNVDDPNVYSSKP